MCLIEKKSQNDSLDAKSTKKSQTQVISIVDHYEPSIQNQINKTNDNVNIPYDNIKPVKDNIVTQPKFNGKYIFIINFKYFYFYLYLHVYIINSYTHI